MARGSAGSRAVLSVPAACFHVKRAITAHSIVCTIWATAQAQTSFPMPLHGTQLSGISRPSGCPAVHGQCMSVLGMVLSVMYHAI